MSEVPDNEYFQVEADLKNKGLHAPIYIKRRGDVLWITTNGIIFVSIPDAFPIILCKEGIVVKTREADEYDQCMAAG